MDFTFGIFNFVEIGQPFTATTTKKKPNSFWNLETDQWANKHKILENGKMLSIGMSWIDAMAIR